ncbi:Cytochrome bo(3) ubiquinol oxidase subunit 3 [Buchnera aphidicola (Eriosoma grossulariae)]|uniref:cytochrome o ubiquinol oxidase subunit III n=1 Tax=Buchnera aphidicola TaxID=9 RepID=UPI003464CA0C
MQFLNKNNSLNSNYVVNKKILLGFWLYLMSDCIIFSTMFAVYAVLLNDLDYNIYGMIIINLPLVLAETFVLLFSSFFFGMAVISFLESKKKIIYFWLSNTFLFGLCFVSIEIYEFCKLLSKNYGPQRSGFLSAYFTLIGLHAIHIIIGLIWIIVILLQLKKIGLNNVMYTRMKCLGLFWHFLDIIWIFLFTFVYLFGVC